jgi:choline monooxygenase
MRLTSSATWGGDRASGLRAVVGRLSFPGGMNTSRINPAAVNSTELIYDFRFADVSAENEPSRRNTIEVNSGIVREDFGVCESTQNNYASGG